MIQKLTIRNDRKQLWVISAPKCLTSLSFLWNPIPYNDETHQVVVMVINILCKSHEICCKRGSKPEDIHVLCKSICLLLNSVHTGIECLATYVCLDFIINVKGYDIVVDLTLLRQKWSQLICLIQQLYINV